MINLKDKKILITGATGGIGGAIVKKLISLNAKVCCTGTNIKKLENLKKNHPTSLIKQFDISNKNIDLLRIFVMPTL